METSWPCEFQSFEDLDFVLCEDKPKTVRAVGLAVNLPGVRWLDDSELDTLEVQERKRVEELNRQIAELRARLGCHEQRRCRFRRELLRRRFASSALGQLMGSAVPPFLAAPDVLHWLAASPAAAAQLCCFPMTSDAGNQDAPRMRLHHLRSLRAGLVFGAAQAVVASLHWPAVETISLDLGLTSWSKLLEALWEAQKDEETFTKAAVELRGLKALAVTFPAERSITTLQQWHCAAPQLCKLGELLAQAPLQELVLTDLRSTQMLTAALASPSSHLLRVCRASFIGPESRRHPLMLPTSLPSLQCLMVQYRDFREQRASRQERMHVLAAPLLACLCSVREPTQLRVLALSGIAVDGTTEETAALLHGLSAFGGLVAVALRFSVPTTFRTLLPLRSLIELRHSWPLVGHFALGEQSLHGFDYWPQQMTDFQQLYPEGGVPEPFKVFCTEFRHVVVTQYGSTAEQVWMRLTSQQQNFWAQIAKLLPAMPHSEVRQRVAEIFPSCI
mmetsp:Transcript_93572/g.166473  ORF Transcript_93572/g.166473 Transcript_93572/m.166473 type:complete len:503 (+) Transcript_93572:36-1544(+)